MQVVTISIWLNFGGPAPPGRGSAAGGNFGCLTTAITDSVHLWGDCSGRTVFASLWALFHSNCDSSAIVGELYSLECASSLFMLNSFTSYFTIVRLVPCASKLAKTISYWSHVKRCASPHNHTEARDTVQTVALNHRSFNLCYLRARCYCLSNICSRRRNRQWQWVVFIELYPRGFGRRRG